jgi:phytanoyl-CoA hydroxylase
MLDPAWLARVPDDRALEGALACMAADGWARLGPVLSAAGVEALRRRADALMLGEVVHPGLFFQHDAASGRYEDLEHGKGWVGPSSAYRKLEKLELDPLFRAWIDNPVFERVARALIDGPVAVYRAVLFNKAATGSSPLPWHQDGGRFWGVEPAPTLQLWTALDPATPASGCLEVLPGSHREGLATPLGGVVPADRVLAADAERRAVPVPAVPGEVLLIHNHLWHRSGANASGAPRRALTVCYMTASTRCLRTRRAPRTFFRAFDRGEPPAGP